MMDSGPYFEPGNKNVSDPPLAKPLLIYGDYGEDTEQTAPASLWMSVSREEKSIDLNISVHTEITLTSNEFMLRITPAQARSIAYSLLWHANDVENPNAWKEHP